MIRRVVLLGATGSIGTQAVDVVRAHPERFAAAGLGAGSDIDTLADQAELLEVDELAVADPAAARRLRRLLPGARVREGPEGVAELAALDADVVLNAVTGARGLPLTLAALEAGTPVALANKESLVVGGDLVVAAAERAGGLAEHVLPVDSEHSALAQCLRGGARGEVARLVLTASGGPFRGAARDELQAVTVEDALAHPTWDMGPVVTINSATLMNKGLELIEAHLLFQLPLDRIEVVVHPQSIVHSMVEFADGSTLAQLSPPDMRMPLQLALGWPERLDRPFTAMDWTKRHELTFEPPDVETFPALRLARAAGRHGGGAPAVLNAANEVAVEAFRQGGLGFLDIAAVVGEVLDEYLRGEPEPPRDLDQLRAADRWAREQAGTAVASRQRVAAT